MCGIIGYIGKKNCPELIYQGLEKLEYRGYDSAGIAVLKENHIFTVKSEGKLSRLRPHLYQLPTHGNMGMGHTRWATHGEPSDKNAHPHSAAGASIVHNGILENYKELKLELISQGVSFASETDTEVIVHLLLRELEKPITVVQALKNILPRLQGAYALGIITVKDPTSLYLVKQGSPMVIGYGEGEMFFASDAIPLAPYCKQFLYLEDGEFAKISMSNVQVWGFAGDERLKTPISIDWDSASAEKGGFDHYMLKEIHEQPKVFSSTISRHIDINENRIRTDKLGFDALDLSRIKRVHLVACGSAYYAAFTGKYLLESLARVNCEVELASEFRYREPFLSNDTLVIAVSQSGETADTLASIKYARTQGCQTLAVCNVRFSSIPRECQTTLYMEAGPEVGVASTKAVTSMMLNLHIFALALAQQRGVMSQDAVAQEIVQLKKLPHLAEQALQQSTHIAETAKLYFQESHCLFLGRGLSFPTALEGALKLKEISYIHAEGYAGGELKHGPIALIDKAMPVIAIVPRDKLYDKMLSNIEEVRARKGRIIAIAASDDRHIREIAECVMPCPSSSNACVQAVLSGIILQQFAYYMALHRGTDVDQPRNLAKSVTVE